MPQPSSHPAISRDLPSLPATEQFKLGHYRNLGMNKVSVACLVTAGEGAATMTRNINQQRKTEHTFTSMEQIFSAWG